MTVDVLKLLEVVEEAGSLARQAFSKGNYAVHEKAKGDWASTADAQIEGFLKNELKGLIPGAQFLGEETGLSRPNSMDPQALRGHDSELTWIVDPIDGTANFVRGIPHFCSVVALVNHRMEPLLGVIVDPCRQESFWAEKGKGARLNHHVLKNAVDRSALESLLAIVTPKPQSPIASCLDAWLPMAIRSFGGIRRSGAMALDLAWLAAGRMDAFVGFNLDPWDVMAGALLVQESGGHYNEALLDMQGSNSDIAGSALKPGNRRVAAAVSRHCLEAVVRLDKLVSQAQTH